MSVRARRACACACARKRRRNRGNKKRSGDTSFKCCEHRGYTLGVSPLYSTEHSETGTWIYRLGPIYPSIPLQKLASNVVAVKWKSARRPRGIVHRSFIPDFIPKNFFLHSQILSFSLPRRIDETKRERKIARKYFFLSYNDACTYSRVRYSLNLNLEHTRVPVLF